MSPQLVQKTAEYVKIKLAGEPTGHDWFHVERVWKMAKRLQIEVGGDLEIIELAALLHDLGDYGNPDEFDEGKGSLMLNGMMDILEIEEVMKKKIIQIINESQFKGSDTKPASTVEGRVIQDAAWLDAIGAVGIARVFATGGFIKRTLHDPHKRIRRKLTKEIYKSHKNDGTSFNSFFEKILKLPKLMNTETGRRIAERRADFLQHFIDLPTDKICPA
mgnify:FL=1